jgi:hypothetical protein
MAVESGSLSSSGWLCGMRFLFPADLVVPGEADRRDNNYRTTEQESHHRSIGL